jgi:hypothetical protein
MVGLPARVARSLIIRGAGFYLEDRMCFVEPSRKVNLLEITISPSGQVINPTSIFYGFYDDGVGFFMPDKDYEIALYELNIEFPGVRTENEISR